MKWSALTKIKTSLRTPRPVPTVLHCLLTFSFAPKPEHSANEPQQTGPSFHTDVIIVWSSGMWHSNHRECSEPVDQRCCVTSAKPRIIFHTAIFRHVTPCHLIYSYERTECPSCLHLHAPSLLTPWTDRQTERQQHPPKYNDTVNFGYYDIAWYG